jgi:hypothetical protein
MIASLQVKRCAGQERILRHKKPSHRKIGRAHTHIALGQIRRPVISGAMAAWVPAEFWATRFPQH